MFRRAHMVRIGLLLGCAVFVAPRALAQTDYGDAPASYGDPSHAIASGFSLGGGNTAEAGPYNSSDSDGDAGDDAVVMPDFVAGQFHGLAIPANGNGGRLQMWVDWNRDGDFGDASERVATDIQPVNGVATVGLRAPLSLREGRTVARLRWSSQAGLGPDGPAPDGEVEDHALSLTRPTRFNCNGVLYQIARNRSRLRSLGITQTATGYRASFSDIGGVDFRVNAGWGYNEQDDFIYGVRENTREIWRVDADGAFTQLTDLPPTAGVGRNAGDMLPDGTMIYRTESNRWVALDMTDPLAPVHIGNIQLTIPLGTLDFGLNPHDGLLYGVSGRRLFYVELPPGRSGTATPVFFGPSAYTGSYGAAWFDEDGNMYLYDNNSDRIFIIDVGIRGDGVAEPVFLADSDNDDGGFNDGAYCRGPAPLPVGAISGTLYGDGDRNDVLSSGETGIGSDVRVSLYDDNGTPGDFSDDTLLRRTSSAPDGTYVFASQRTLPTYRVEVDVSDPDLPPDAPLGTANPLTGISVIADTLSGGNDFGFDTAAVASFDGRKTVASWDPSGAGGFNIPGNDVVYTIRVANTGSVATDADSLFVVDTLRPELTLWLGDLEAGGADTIPGTDPVAMLQSGGAALQFDFATDFGVATGVSQPSSFADCSPVASTGQYAPAARHLCFRPRGGLGTGDPDPQIEFRFRARIE